MVNKLLDDEFKWGSQGDECDLGFLKEGNVLFNNALNTFY